MIDIKQVQAEAEKELRDERMKEAKSKIKSKLMQIHAAEKIVANLKRELDDLYVVVGQDS